jgi:predicted phosphodiesterase
MGQKSPIPPHVWRAAESLYPGGGALAAVNAINAAGYQVTKNSVVQHMNNLGIVSFSRQRAQDGARTAPKLVIPPFPDDVEVRAVFLGDTQVPETDYSAHRVATQFVAHYLGKHGGPSYLFLMGDMLDAARLSRFDVSLDAPDIGEEIQQLKRLIADWRNAAPNAVAVYVAGNHEWRVEKAIRQNPSLGVLVKPLPDLLDLAALGVEHFIPYLPSSFVEFCGSLLVTHGYKVGANSGYSAHRTLSNTGFSVIHGHTHRLAVVAKTLYDRQLYAIENGALAVPQSYVAGVADWQCGFTYSRHWGRRFEPWQMRIIDGRGFAEGQWFG